MNYDSGNSQGRFTAFSALNAVRQDKNARDEAYNRESTNKNTPTYRHVLDWVQERISNSQEYNRLLQDALENNTASDQLSNLIYTLLQQYPHSLSAPVIANYRTRIYEDMAGLSILSKYVEDPDVEEINVFGPGPYQIEIITSKGSELLPEGFPDAISVQNIVKRMVRQGGMTIDAQTPRVDSYMNDGTRISAMIPPVVRDDKGAVCSIRKQTKSKITREMLIKGQTAMSEEFELIELCAQSKISGAIIGATGSGKTTLLNYVLSDYVNNTKGDTRVYIIEESRELQLPANAKVIYTAVCGDERNGNQITAPDLLKSALRFHPTFISCAEMRGEEAMNAMTAAQTGHIVWSTFHADNCVEAYQRLLTMCKMSGTDLSEHLLMRNLISAFPIIVSTQQMKDGTRKITGIYEADSVDGVTVLGHYIYRMQIKEYVYDDTGSVTHVRGQHCRVGNLSDKMAQRIFDECGQLNRISKFARPGWMPESLSSEQMRLTGESSSTSGAAIGVEF